MAYEGTLQQAVGLRGLHHDEHRPLHAVELPEVTGQTGGHAADTTLQEHMGETARLSGLGPGLFHNLLGDGAVALHHIARDVFVAFVGGVRHHLPAIRPGQPRRLFHRLVVVASDAHDTTLATAA